ncbi:UDP-glucuronosyltransferase [Aphelenchoides besseyi]|nr:UDP-glucuronosyltransferase [Aphelenchoides besseyi]
MFYNPRFGLSHVNYIGKLADILADKGGHEIITYQPINNQHLNKTGTKRSKMIIREPDYPFEIDLLQLGKDAWNKKGFFEMSKLIDKVAGFFVNSCRHQLNDKKLLDQLRAENASLGLTENFDMCGPLLFHKIGLKFALIYAGSLPQMMTSELGIPAITSFLPGMMTSMFPPLDFKSKVLNVFAETFGMMLFSNKLMGPFEKLAQEHFGSNFRIMTLCAEANLFFVNTDPFVEYPRPLSDKIVYIGGTGLSKPKPVDIEFQKVMDNSKKGVILISFGTITPSYTMPSNIRDAFLSAFDHFPDVTFVWKYEKENDFNKKHPNLITSPWLPQTDLLAHPKMLAFLTHGGANSVIEASTIGIPLIVCPLFADQPRNAILVEFRKIGVQIDSQNLTAENIVNAINEIIDNHSYRQNAKEMAKVIAAKPMNADDTFVKYSELAAQFDLHSKLDMPGRHLSTFVFYNIDVYLFFVIILVVFILLTFFVNRLFVRCIRRRFQKSKTE